MARELATNDTLKGKLQSVVAKGGLVMQVVGIDGQVSKDVLTAWVKSQKIAMTAVRDPDDLYPQSRSVFITREWTFIVDLSTMKVVGRYFGSHGGGQQTTDAMNKAMDDILGRL